uniref:Uncharacterized protein n=1 Tax=Brassica oleracea var. oleracea TaxID=109376 RepID=A0A0D3E4M1_BRAOL
MNSSTDKDSTIKLSSKHLDRRTVLHVRRLRWTGYLCSKRPQRTVLPTVLWNFQ